MMEKITVMHLRATNFVGGPEKQILEHLSRMDSDRFQMVLTTFRENRECCLYERAQQLGLNCRSIKERNPFDFRMVKDLVALIRQDNVQLLCTHGYKPDIVGRVACWVAGIPQVVISRGWTWENAKIRFYEALDRKFMKWADHVVSVSTGQRDKILKCGIKPEKVSVIYNGIDVEAHAADGEVSFREEIGLGDTNLFVVSGGRLSPEKNFACFIDAAARVIKTESNVSFAIFGEGTLRQDLEQQIVSLGLEGRFYLPGFREDFGGLLAEADIFVLSSLTEGLPNVILEAFACHKPVVATAVGGTPEVILDKKSGFLVQACETDCLAESIVALCRDSDLRRRMGEVGFNDVKQRFSYQSQTVQYETLYQRLANEIINS